MASPIGGVMEPSFKRVLTHPSKAHLGRWINTPDRALSTGGCLTSLHCAFLPLTLAASFTETDSHLVACLQVHQLAIRRFRKMCLLIIPGVVLGVMPKRAQFTERGFVGRGLMIAWERGSQMI
jgi:hypothetical protein